MESVQNVIGMGFGGREESRATGGGMKRFSFDRIHPAFVLLAVIAVLPVLFAAGALAAVFVVLAPFLVLILPERPDPRREDCFA